VKILMVDKYYFIKGGAERYFFELIKVLEENGHTVVPFSMQHPENFETPYEDDFVENIDFNKMPLMQKVLRMPEIAGRVIYYRKAQKKLAALIEREKPDIAHVHMIDHQLSPSILATFKEFGIPIVQTCHQYKLVCPSYRLFLMHKNEICERCLNGNYMHAFIQKCHKNSYAASALVALEGYIHRMMKIHDLIDIFHVPSHFLGEKLIEGGFDASRVWHSFYTINMKDYPYHPEYENYFIYFGRLSEEKGIMTLLNAMKVQPQAQLKILGDGPFAPALKKYAEQNQLNNVEFCGNVGGEKLVNLVQNCRFVVVPSEWYDNSPLVIYESFSMGKPVIVSTMGGMPELVDHGENGYHFKAGDEKTLADLINKLWGDKELCMQMSVKARAKAEAEFSPEVHYKKIIALYRSLIMSQQSGLRLDAAALDEIIAVGA